MRRGARFLHKSGADDETMTFLRPDGVRSGGGRGCWVHPCVIRVNPEKVLKGAQGWSKAVGKAAGEPSGGRFPAGDDVK